MPGEHERFMRMALDEAARGKAEGNVAVGSVIVQGERVVALGRNLVTSTFDPTAHAEVTAIRAACSDRGIDLSGCTIYASCEPCPMCLGAIYWARISAVVYAATRHDAAAAGFSDEMIYRALSPNAGPPPIPLHRIDHAAALEPFRAWTRKTDKISY